MKEQSIILFPASDSEGALILTATPDSQRVVHGATGMVLSQMIDGASTYNPTGFEGGLK